MTTKKKNRSKTMLCLRLGKTQNRALSKLAKTLRVSRTDLFADCVSEFLAKPRKEQREVIDSAEDDVLMQVCLYLPPIVYDRVQHLAEYLHVPATVVMRAAIDARTR